LASAADRLPSGEWLEDYVPKSEEGDASSLGKEDSLTSSKGRGGNGLTALVGKKSKKGGRRKVSNTLDFRKLSPTTEKEGRVPKRV